MRTVFKDSEVIFPLLILVLLSDVSKVCSWRLKHFVQGSILFVHLGLLQTPDKINRC